MTGPMLAQRQIALLGPTNTGKTHFAVERMLGHSSGMIGLPLRLLAREVYDRIVELRGAARVALVTGEERIVPPNPSYWVCTVESMPIDLDVAFLAVDEIQLCGDAERGHVFTDRLLRARGREETMFMGADTIGPIIRKLLPDFDVQSRTRFSTLSYAGPKKLSRLPRRSAIVAFTANDVYAIAEMVRRRKGGTAVVMGALSPRTRNAQVAMYQQGEVDFIVATDAIGMGLNMNINHVAFASLSKFDGTRHRPLHAAELAQIAGRAGRHMNDGSFGVVADGYGDFAGKNASLDPAIVEAIEEHRFPAFESIQWRNAELNFGSPGALIRSLTSPSNNQALQRAVEAEDLQALKALSQDPAIASLAAGPAAVGALWQTCQIPDFRKTMSEEHKTLIGGIYQHLMSIEGCLPEDWVAKQVAKLDRIDGDLDTLASRIAHVRTWTYIANRPDWLRDPAHWRETTRGIEDRLSDALHEKLTERFVDKRSAVLMKRLQADEDLVATVSTDSDVLVEGHFVGKIEGLSFVIDDETTPSESAVVMAAAAKALRREISRRVRTIESAGNDLFSLEPENGEISFSGAAIARIIAGGDPLNPQVKVLADASLETTQRDIVAAKSQAWLAQHLRANLPRLYGLSDAVRRANKKSADGVLSGNALGTAFALLEDLGSIPRKRIARELKKLEQPARAELRRLGVRFGEASLFIPDLVKPRAASLRVMLWAAYHGLSGELPALPKPGLNAVPVIEAPRSFYEMAGFRVVGNWAVRHDILEKLAELARAPRSDGELRVDEKMISLLGSDACAVGKALEALGYRPNQPDAEAEVTYSKHHNGKQKRIRPRKKKSKPTVSSSSPFSGLDELLRSGAKAKTVNE